MKRLFVTASALALGVLGFAAPRAAASNETVQVPFAGAVVQSCAIAVLPTPGVLALDPGDAKTLTSENSLPGTLTVLCNTDFDVETGEPVETSLLNTVNADTKSSTIRDITTPLGAVTGTTGLSSGLLHTIQVDMTASRTGENPDIEAGAYSYNVPVTVICP